MKEFIDCYNAFMHNHLDINTQSNIIYHNLNVTLSNTPDINAKAFVLELMIGLFPNDHELYYKMGNLFKGISKEKQLFWYKLSFNIKPDYTDNFCDLCDLLLDMGFINHIFTLNKNNLFEKFMKEPRFLTVYTRCNLANLKYENGLKCLLDLIKMNSLKPSVTDYDKNEKWRNYHDAGYLFSAKCDVDNSIKYSQKALDLAKKFKLDFSKKKLSLQNILCFSDYKYEDHDLLFKKYLEINTLMPDNPIFSFKNRSRKSKIKIGYISSDFVMHSVSNFIVPILKNHNKNKFEIYLFANSSDVNIMYKNLGYQIHSLVNLSNKDAAELINKQNIDILFDLNGHTVNNKLEIFTYHPAPIQVSYLGFPNTTGLKAIDYRITDNIADSLTTKQNYSEELLRLPKCFLLFEPIHNFIPNPRKTQDRIILGAINKENKANDELLKTWSIILERCPNTVILLKLESFDNKEERTQFYINKLNIDKTRIIVLNKLPNNEYEKIFTMFDILLDTFPYSGTTTTCNSLYNSIPVITLYHPDYHVNNVSSSLLINSGYPELVAKTKEEYIDITVNLVNNPDRINEYKRTMRDKFLTLMRPKEFMHDYENALTNIYEKSFLEKNTEPIVINFNENLSLTNNIKKNIYICGCVKNCEMFLEKIFNNIDKIISVFLNYKIIIAYDTNNDKTVDILKNKKFKYNLELINVPENNYIIDYTMRSKRISNARNEIINYIYKENNSEYEYFIIMDMDDVCSGNMNINTLKSVFENGKDSEWDSVSFNRKDYFDIWALSIDPYMLSCWHFPGGFDIVYKIKNYITDKLNKLDKSSLLSCDSAFNGFAIYKKDKFVNCIYDWQIKNNYDNMLIETVIKNENALGVNFTVDQSYHEVINPITDCEHRYFHMQAISQNNARICISPLFLFTD
jgi:predicted O-linked N-acetylglucosamine transferase (SPINDLY family)